MCMYINKHNFHENNCQKWGDDISPEIEKTITFLLILLLVYIIKTVTHMFSSYYTTSHCLVY